MEFCHLRCLKETGPVAIKKRSDPLKKNESDFVQLNVKNSALTNNKELDSDFREIDCTREKQFAEKCLFRQHY